MDQYLGIENIKNPIGLVEKIKDIVGIPDDFFNSLKFIDPVDYIKKRDPFRALKET